MIEIESDDELVTVAPEDARDASVLVRVGVRAGAMSAAAGRSRAHGLRSGRANAAPASDRACGRQAGQSGADGEFFQAVPFQRRITTSAPALTVPTAQALVAEAAATP
jgi:hypothetical protein